MELIKLLNKILDVKNHLSTFISLCMAQGQVALNIVAVISFNMLYFLHNSSVLSFYIDVVLTLSNWYSWTLSLIWWKCKYFPRYWPFVRGINRSPVNSPHKGQWRGTLMLSLICAWINSWVSNREAGDLTIHRVRYDVIVMESYLPMCTRTPLFSLWPLDIFYRQYRRKICNQSF